MITGSTGIGNQGGNGNRYGGNGKGKGGRNGQGSTSTQRLATSGIPQANVTAVSTVHGVVNSHDLAGMSVTLDDGTNLYVQLGTSRYNQSAGFAPRAGEGVTIMMFPGDLGVYSAVTLTLDSTGQMYSFRDANGRSL